MGLTIMEDRMSELPKDVLLMILSYLPVRSAASTTVLSSRWLDLWKQMLNLESDRISQLPDQIISVILSFLPLKEAAATSVLSSRWSDSWKHTPNLDFHCDIVPGYNRMGDPDVLKYMEIVNSILHSHKSLSLKQFRINIRFLEKSAKRAVTKWLGKCVEFVFLRKIESLELYCWMDGDDKVVLGESLREMKTMHGNPPRSLIFFESLKSLQLAYLEVSGEDVEMFLRNCPLLEKLMIRNVSLTSDIEVCSPSLKRLEITWCTGGKSIKVSAPNLTFINFDDQVGKLLFENVPRLVVADFAIRTSEFIKDHFNFASAASSCISQLQFLDIFYDDSKVFWKNAFPQLPNLKKLTVTPINAAYDQSLLPVTRLIWASPRLEEFTLLFNSFREEPSAYMQEIENDGRSPHQHLKVLNLYLFYRPYRQRVNDHMVELMNYVSNNCVALRRIDIVCSEDSAPGLLQTQLPNHVQLSVTPEHFGRQMPKLKKLSITSVEMYNHSLLPVTRLIWASPRLEEFILEFRGSREAPTPYMHEISNVGRSPHQHLKAFHLFFPDMMRV